MNRRALLSGLVKGLAVTGAAFVAWPFVKSWIPEFDNDVGRDVDLGDLKPGEVKTVRWQGRNVMILKRNRTMLGHISRASDLKDPRSEYSVQPPAATNRWRSLVPEYFVAFANCTHLGCEVTASGMNQAGVGFECPCHHSEYDYAGRIKTGSVAPLNMEVPHYRLISGNLIRLQKAEG